MNLIFFLLFGVAIFALSLVGYGNYRSTTLYALAIGGVVNANYFYASAYPVCIFGLPFGIDSLIYTLFAFCVMTMLLQKGRREAYLLALSSIVAILFSACMELVARLFNEGSTPAVWRSFAVFFISAFASAVAVIAAVEVVNRVKKKHNPYLCMALGIGMIILLDSNIYYPLTALVSQIKTVWLYVGTSLMGKAVGMLLALGAFAIMCRMDKKT